MCVAIKSCILFKLEQKMLYLHATFPLVMELVRSHRHHYLLTRASMDHSFLQLRNYEEVLTFCVVSHGPSKIEIYMQPKNEIFFLIFQGHLETCRYNNVLCPNDCSAQLSRMSLEDHLHYACPRRRVTCEFCSQEYTGEAMEVSLVKLIPFILFQIIHLSNSSYINLTI